VRRVVGESHLKKRVDNLERVPLVWFGVADHFAPAFPALMAALCPNKSKSKSMKPSR
jgi:hypothetical protein